MWRRCGSIFGASAHRPAATPTGSAKRTTPATALDFLRARHPTLPLWIAGFSFGARVGLSVGARDARVEKLLGVGLALKMFDYGLLASSSKPKAIIQASEDEYGARDAIEAAVLGMSEPKRLWVVDGATHLFPGQLDPFEAAAREAVSYLKGAF